MAGSRKSFFDLYEHGFARVAIGVPRVRVADPQANRARIEHLYARAADAGAALVVMPELSLSGYSLDDLHQQDALQAAVRGELDRLRGATARAGALLVVGAPLRFEGRLFNCAVALAGGRIVAVAPKTYLPNYREFYEKRQFTSGAAAPFDEVDLAGELVPFGNDLVLRAAALPALAVHMEVCEDVWAPIPPSTYAALRGATVLVNLSASNITIGKAAYRQQLAAGQSAKTLSAYLYAAAGPGESTTDLAWDGHAFAYENGELLAESERFSEEEQLVLADVDLDRLLQERSRMTSFQDCAAAHASAVRAVRGVAFDFAPPAGAVRLARRFSRFPFVPRDDARRDERCYEAYHIQVAGLAQRLRSTEIEKVVVGVSGGLDSTQALLVAARTMDVLGFPRRNVLGYSLPGFATSEHTRKSAGDLMDALGVSKNEIDIRPACRQVFQDIDHPFARGEALYDRTFENVQAGERTSLLFRLANRHDALVVGTGDLSELALGWCTYGVGDQMSHYAVNVSVPKTLIRHLVGWVAEREVDAAAAGVLRRILDTAISPELVPGDADGERGPSQRTEAEIGPYELHDFTLYYLTRRGYGPAKIAFLAAHAWTRDAPGGDALAPYTLDEVFRWQRVFLERFVAGSQFKRSAIPNGPKVGSGGSLSPRGDWRAPSDASAAPWLAAHDAALEWARESLRDE